MPGYHVIRKADGHKVYSYQSNQPIEWVGMEFSTHDHVVVPEVTQVVQAYTGTWQITKLAFRQRFTQAEKTAMEIAGLDNPAAPMAQRQMAGALRASMADLMASTFIDLQRPDTRAGVQQLEALGLLAAGRSAVILDTAPTGTEIYNG